MERFAEDQILIYEWSTAATFNYVLEGARTDDSSTEAIEFKTRHGQRAFAEFVPHLRWWFVDIDVSS